MTGYFHLPFAFLELGGEPPVAISLGHIAPSHVT
jgi:hypothetical protein